MKKYLDILIFALLFFLLFSYFQGKGQSQNMTGLQFSAVKKSYSVPAGVSLQFANNTGEKIEFNTCEALSLRYAGESVIMPEDMCQDISLASQEKKVIDFSRHYDIFSQTGNYTFELQHKDKKLISQTEVKYR